MLGKMMLPHVGGAPSGWAVTMFFFQTCLLFGYGLAHVFSKLAPFLNAIAILLVFIPGALFLPLSYNSGLSDTISPLAVFIQLTLSTAVPFLALSTLSPGLQRLFSFSNHETASDPYYLYAASNIGSFVGLLAYPIILEPLVGLTTQSQIWMSLFGLLFFCVALCAFIIFKNRRDLVGIKFEKTEVKTNLKTHQDDKAVTWRRRVKWLLLAAIPSSLMIGVTTEITTDIASAPMIWVIPLGLYLITTIIAFSKRDTINTKLLSSLHLLGVAVVTINIMMSTGLTDSTLVALSLALLYLAVFTVTALLLHSLLANDRPQTNKLTEFYLFLALGGAIGGSFNAFIAPNIFNDVYEFFAVLLLSLFLNPNFHEKTPPSLSKMLNSIVIIAALIAIVVLITGFNSIHIKAVLLLFIFFATVQARTLFFMGCIVFLLSFTSFTNKNIIDTHRNFFGVTKVFTGDVNGNKNAPATLFAHGKTLHGFQPTDDKINLRPSAYYAEAGPIGDVYRIIDPKEVAVLGLGTGQLSCYKKSGRHYTYYEIDPYVVDIAKKYFTYLDGCGHKDVIVGDARLELAKDPKKYDLIFVDTFSSDSVPMHLITTEAFKVYFSKLNDNGIVVINVSNNHIDLTGALAALAKDQGYYYQQKFYRINKNSSPYDLSSNWVVFTKNKSASEKLLKRGWETKDSNLRPWTDDYSNFIAVLKIFNITHSKENKENVEKK
ncbi:MAG: fused MFS/spermidine synthase [Alphaproteobacteria bacterium]